VDVAFRKLCFDSCVDIVGVRANAEQAFRRQVIPNERLSLVSLLLAGVVRMVFKISTVKKLPVYMVKIVQIAEISRCLRKRVLISEHELNSQFRHPMQRRYKNYDFLILNSFCVVTGMNVEHHD
jgi:hypothetical protein